MQILEVYILTCIINTNPWNVSQSSLFGLILFCKGTGTNCTGNKTKGNGEETQRRGTSHAFNLRNVDEIIRYSEKKKEKNKFKATEFSVSLHKPFV